MSNRGRFRERCSLVAPSRKEVEEQRPSQRLLERKIYLLITDRMREHIKLLKYCQQWWLKQVCWRQELVLANSNEPNSMHTCTANLSIFIHRSQPPSTHHTHQFEKLWLRWKVPCTGNGSHPGENQPITIVSHLWDLWAVHYVICREKSQELNEGLLAKVFTNLLLLEKYKRYWRPTKKMIFCLAISGINGIQWS